MKQEVLGVGVLAFSVCGIFIKRVNFQISLWSFSFKRVLANKGKGYFLAELLYHIIKYSE